MTARQETISVAIMTALIVTAVLEVPRYLPLNRHLREQVVSAQAATITDTSNPSCAITSAPTALENGEWITGSFVCVADLDGTGTKQIILGNSAVVTIINNTGAVRKTVSPWQ